MLCRSVISAMAQILCLVIFLLMLIFFLKAISPLYVNPEVAGRQYKDILFVIVDDLRNLPDYDDTILVPNILQMAGNGIHFENCYAQQALCAPSRNSLLTGRRPDTLRLYDFYSYWRESVANFTTLPQLFKEQGYRTYSVGKVFHPGKSSNFTDDYPYSWSVPPYHPPTEIYKDASVCEDNSTELHANLICPVRLERQPGNTLPDLETLHKSIEILDQERGHPVLLAVGFQKPHIPLKFPEEYLDLYSLEKISPARQPNRPYSMPQVAWHPWTDIRKRHDISKLHIPFPFGAMPDYWARKIKQSYFGCVSYVDNLLGRLLRHVDKDNTIIVFTSDHGWSLGENGLWAKYSNFDVDLKVPLILYVPNYEPLTISEPVELIDLFPTLVELSGLKLHVPKCLKNSKQHLCFEGKSLVPLMSRQGKRLAEKSKNDYIAFSQCPRPSVYPQRNSDKPRLKDINIMGYSLKTERFRYTEWVEFNNTAFYKNWSNVYGVELYDHRLDKYEALNLYKRPGLEQLTANFSRLLRDSFS